MKEQQQQQQQQYGIKYDDNDEGAFGYDKSYLFTDLTEKQSRLDTKITLNLSSITDKYESNN